MLDAGDRRERERGGSVHSTCERTEQRADGDETEGRGPVDARRLSTSQEAIQVQGSGTLVEGADELTQPGARVGLSLTHSLRISKVCACVSRGAMFQSGSNAAGA